MVKPEAGATLNPVVASISNIVMTQDRSQDRPDAPPEDRREPMFNAPWPGLLVAASIVVSPAILGRLPEEALLKLALSPATLWAGEWTSLVTSLVINPGWVNAIMSAALALAFGAPVARFLGLSGARGALFLLFYIACGVFAWLGYASVHPYSVTLVAGAAGATAGLMGAAARLMDHPGQLSGLFGPRALSLGLGWLIINLIFAVVGGLPIFGLGSTPWEANLFGFAAGAILISPLSWIAAPPRPIDP